MSDKPISGMNVETVWTDKRVNELSVLRDLVRTAVAINRGSHALDKIGICIALAEKLDETNYVDFHESFLTFLNKLAVKDRSA